MHPICQLQPVYMRVHSLYLRNATRSRSDASQTGLILTACASHLLLLRYERAFNTKFLLGSPPSIATIAVTPSSDRCTYRCIYRCTTTTAAAATATATASTAYR